MNNCTFVGTISRTPEVKHIGKEKTVCNFTLVITEEYQGKQFRTSINMAAWNSQADKCRGLVEGDKLFIMGKLQNRSYEGKDGQKKWVTEVNVRELHVMAGDPSSITHSRQAEEGENDLPF